MLCAISERIVAQVHTHHGYASAVNCIHTKCGTIFLEHCALNGRWGQCLSLPLACVCVQHLCCWFSLCFLSYDFRSFLDCIQFSLCRDHVWDNFIFFLLFGFNIHVFLQFRSHALSARSLYHFRSIHYIILSSFGWWCMQFCVLLTLACLAYDTFGVAGRHILIIGTCLAAEYYDLVCRSCLCMLNWISVRSAHHSDEVCLIKH